MRSMTWKDVFLSPGPPFSLFLGCCVLDSFSSASQSAMTFLPYSQSLIEVLSQFKCVVDVQHCNFVTFV